jgi:hypothetical protein
LDRIIKNVKTEEIINNKNEILKVYSVEYISNCTDYKLSFAENQTTKEVLLLSDINNNVYVVNNRPFYMDLLAIAKIWLNKEVLNIG